MSHEHQINQVAPRPEPSFVAPDRDTGFELTTSFELNRPSRRRPATANVRRGSVSDPGGASFSGSRTSRFDKKSAFPPQASTQRKSKSRVARSAPKGTGNTDAPSARLLRPKTACRVFATKANEADLEEKHHAGREAKLQKQENRSAVWYMKKLVDSVDSLRQRTHEAHMDTKQRLQSSNQHRWVTSKSYGPSSQQPEPESRLPVLHGVDLDGDGLVDLVVLAADKDGDGVPDCLQHNDNDNDRQDDDGVVDAMNGLRVDVDCDGVIDE